MNKSLCLTLAIILTAATGLSAQTDFFKLCATGSATQISQALDKGAKIESRDDQQLTPLMYAAQNNPDPAVIGLLLKAGAGINDQDCVGSTALMYAATNNSNPALLQALLKAGADLEAKDSDGWTALLRAARFAGDPAILAVLLDAGADASVKDSDGETAFALANHWNKGLIGSKEFERLKNAAEQ